MTSHSFIELAPGSDGTLRRLLAASCRWGRGRPVYVWLSGVRRDRVEALLDEVIHESGAPQIEFLEPHDQPFAEKVARTAAFCLLSTSTFGAQLGDDQVAVYFPTWRSRKAFPLVGHAVAGD